MSLKSLLVAAVAAAGLAGATPALAQDATLDSRVRESGLLLGTGVPTPPAILTGSGDLVLLAPTRLFTVRAEIAPDYTSNAQLSPDGGAPDRILTGQASISVATKIAGRYGVHAEIGAVSSRYQRDSSLDYDAATADIGADTGWNTRLGGLTAAIGYAPSVIFDSGFAHRRLTQHRVYAGLHLVTPLHRPPPGSRQGAVALVSALAADRTWADPSDYDNWSASVSETLVVRPHPRLQLSLGGGYYVRDYDGYFSGFLGVPRRDHGYRASLAAAWAATPRADPTLRFTHVENRSTSDINPYRADTGGLSLRLSARF